MRSADRDPLFVLRSLEQHLLRFCLSTACEKSMLGSVGIKDENVVIFVRLPGKRPLTCGRRRRLSHDGMKID